MLVAGLLELFEAGIIRREEDGAAIHAGFFVETRDFYEKLRAMPADRLAKLAMMPISFTNSVYGDSYADEGAKRRARSNARFVNSAMMATLLGAAISDTRADGQVVSGVGGQFNFVDQAFTLEGARSIIAIPATRTRAGETSSNIVWSYPFATVPRHMRDIMVTEYGIADLRGQSDADTIREMLRITDSRFQEGLREEACKAGKLPSDWAIPESWRGNTPERIVEWLAPAHDDGHLPAFPLGTDFTPVEQRLLPALDHLREAEGARWRMAALLWRGLIAKPDAELAECLKRMDLDKPSSMKERALRAALLGALMASTGGH
jgi:acyl-CoA hydrolase